MAEFEGDEFETSTPGDTSGGSKASPAFIWKNQYYLGILNWEESVDLKLSLEMVLKKATSCADSWTDVNAAFNDRRSFSTFLWLLQSCGLDWHKYIVTKDYELKVNNQPDRSWSLQQAASYPNLASDSNWVMANKYYDKSLALMQLLQRIHSESGNDYSRQQAALLASFLDHLIKIQQEQMVAAYIFSEHLERLRKSDAASVHAFSSSSAVVDHPMDYYICQQKHLFDSLYIMSRESAWLLRKLEDTYAVSPLLAKESRKILEILVPLIPTFKNCKESLDQYLIDECRCSFSEDKMMKLVQQNDGILADFGKRMEDLQEQGIGRKSISERLPGADIREYITGLLLGCFKDVVNTAKVIIGEHRAELSNPSGDMILSSLGDAYCKAADETLELINEAVHKLNSVMSSLLTSGGSPLGNTKYWRVLFESSLANLRLDRICKKHGQTIELGAKLLRSDDSVLFDHVETYLDRLHESISLLLSTGNKVLHECVAVHRTLAEITYMLGDAFTTGGAGMNIDASEETSLGASSKNEKGIYMDFDDFPWDKHNCLVPVKFDLNDPRMHNLYAATGSVYSADDDLESDTEFI